ncbi:MAG: ice-binding family protein, partial [Ilumatobacteraceae bacterium]
MFRSLARLSIVPLLFVVLLDTPSAQAYTSPGPVDLGSAADFAVLGNTAITNNGSTQVYLGHVGSGPTGFAVSNFPPGVVNSPGILYTSANSATANANAALGTAYSNIAARAVNQTFPNGDGQLNNLILDPGVYRVGSATTAQLAAGTLTLDANNDPNSIWIFQIPGTTLVTAASTQILLTRGAQACNVYWQVGSSATLGASSTFRGNILADTSITVGNSVTVDGRLLAGAVTTSGAVTLDTDTI